MAATHQMSPAMGVGKRTAEAIRREQELEAARRARRSRWTHAAKRAMKEAAA
jgi:hypothetical protein